MKIGRQSVPMGWVALGGVALCLVASCATEVSLPRERLLLDGGSGTTSASTSEEKTSQRAAGSGRSADKPMAPAGFMTSDAILDGTVSDSGPDVDADAGTDESAGQVPGDGQDGKGGMKAGGTATAEPQSPCGQACSATRPICDAVSGQCVGCLEATDCSDPTAPFCIDQRCVSCRTSADCADPAASRCEVESHVCIGCQDGADCEGVMDGDVAATVCAQSDHRCVQCTGTYFQACGVHEDGKTPLVCDSKERRCTERRAGLLRACAGCVSDAECSPGLKCVRETLDGVDLGYVCQQEVGDTAPALPSCQDPAAGLYPRLRSAVPSIDGQEVNVCALRVSTCAATQSFPEGVPCEERGSSDACGAAASTTDLVDAVCVPSDVASPEESLFCAPLCSNSGDCPSSHACVTTANPRYCDPNPENCYVDSDCGETMQCISLTCVPR